MAMDYVSFRLITPPYFPLAIIFVSVCVFFFGKTVKLFKADTSLFFALMMEVDGQPLNDVIARPCHTIVHNLKRFWRLFSSASPRRTTQKHTIDFNFVCFHHSRARYHCHRFFFGKQRRRRRRQRKKIQYIVLLRILYLLTCFGPVFLSLCVYPLICLFGMVFAPPINCQEIWTSLSSSSSSSFSK